ncbi:MAG: hypothetical protein IJA15_07625 [Clostridia bacterium]|nr:hypothetical protein [Clostridia bacterium]
MNKHIKDKVKSAFSAETPDVLDKVVNACENQEQLLSSQDLFESLPAKKFNFKRLILVCSFILLFGIGIFTGINLAGIPKPAAIETVIYIDTLASVEISVDKNDKVIDCKPLNQNAQTVVEGINFSGMEVNATVNVILSSMHVKGMIDSSSNSMLVSVVSKNATSKITINSLTQQISKVFSQSDVNCSIIAQSFSANDDLKQRAKEQGISVGKMFLIDKMAEEMEEIKNENKEILVNMSISELNLLYRSRTDNPRPNEIIVGNVNGFISKEVAIANVHEFIKDRFNIMASEVLIRSIKVVPSNRDGSKIIYLIELERIADQDVERFEVNCETGEVFFASSQGHSLR